MDAPAGIAADIAMSRQNVALSAIKQQTEKDAQIANILEENTRTIPTSGRGGGINISA